MIDLREFFSFAAEYEVKLYNGSIMYTYVCKKCFGLVTSECLEQHIQWHKAGSNDLSDER